MVIRVVQASGIIWMVGLLGVLVLLGLLGIFSEFKGIRDDEDCRD